MKPYPTIHIFGAVGARAAVLIKYPKAKSKRTSENGDKYPIYAIVCGKQELGRGHGVTDAWESTAIHLYADNLFESQDVRIDSREVYDTPSIHNLNA